MRLDPAVYRPDSLLYSINRALAYILLFFALFDAARNYSPLPEAFGYIKDICIYLLFIINIGKIRVSKVLGYSGLLWMVLVIIYSPVGFFTSTLPVHIMFRRWFKFLEFFLLMMIFSNFQGIFHFGIDRYLQMYIKWCMLLCFINIFGYYVDNPIVSALTPNSNVKVWYIQYQGRITVGQPAVASFPVIISFLWLLIYGNSFKQRILAAIYIVCISLANSTTGIISVIACFAIIIIYKIYDRLIKKKRTISVRQAAISLVVFIFLFVLVFVLKEKVQDFVSTIVTFLTRLTRFFHGKDLGVNGRNARVTDALEKFTVFQFITGMGLYGYSSKLGEVIENSYFRCILEYGIIGLSSMLVFFLRFLVYSIRDLFIVRLDHQRNSLFLLCIIVVYLMHLYTLDLFIIYMLYFPLAMLLNYCYFQSTQQVDQPQTVYINTPDTFDLSAN